jgi:ferritin-like metal-binding protein YciE
MMPENEDIKLALLQRDNEQTAQIVSKMDTAIEKLTDLGTDMKQMLALHESRLNRLEQIDNEIQGLVEKRRNELQTDIKDLDGKLASTIKEIVGDIASTETRIMDAIKDVKSDIANDKVTKAASDLALVARVEKLERWRWMMLGGGFVVGFIIEKILPLVLGIHTG